MNKLIRLFGLLVFLNSCDKAVNLPETEIDEASQIQDINQAIAAFQVPHQQFAFDLFKHVLANDPQAENIIVSPFSISAALLMAYNGADGTTKTAMSKALNWDQKRLTDLNAIYNFYRNHLLSQDAIIEIANGIFWDEMRLSPKNDFMDRILQQFEAEASALNFKDSNTKDHINNWVAHKTHDKIKNLLDEIDPQELMFLINALYLKAKWTEEFAADVSYEGEFFLKNGQIISSANFMYKLGNINYHKTEQYEVIDLPFGKQEDLSMSFILPNEMHTVDDFIQNFEPSTFSNLIKEQLEKQIVQLHLPKFKNEYKIGLNSILSALGMSIAFGDQANFSKIADQKLAIKKVLHSTNFTINEWGVEASWRYLHLYFSNICTSCN